MSESQEIKEIKRVYAGLETLYRTYFPKSDPSLIHDLLRRLQKNPNTAPIYMDQGWRYISRRLAGKIGHISRL